MRASKASTGLTLRETTSDDVPALPPLLAELPTDNAGLKRRLDALLADDGALVLVAEEGGHIVGLASMQVMPLIEREPIARLSAIVVAASHRRAGVGRL
jgi:N-acetylglutamate synthase-like GNAT family acetyltransferase